jgi:hypothetical protein
MRGSVCSFGAATSANRSHFPVNCDIRLGFSSYPPMIWWSIDMDAALWRLLGIGKGAGYIDDYQGRKR